MSCKGESTACPTPPVSPPGTNVGGGPSFWVDHVLCEICREDYANLEKTNDVPICQGCLREALGLER